jgi:hypothetical protein
MGKCKTAGARDRSALEGGSKGWKGPIVQGAKVWSKGLEQI